VRRLPTPPGKVRDLAGRGTRTSTSTVPTDNALKIHFSAKVGEEPEMGVG
jgi:hypothetical protein